MTTDTAVTQDPLKNYIVGQKEIARYLGCSESTLKRWLRAGRLPVSKLGEGRTGKIAISSRVLDRWIRRRSKLRRVNLQAQTYTNPL